VLVDVAAGRVQGAAAAAAAAVLAVVGSILVGPVPLLLDAHKRADLEPVVGTVAAGPAIVAAEVVGSRPELVLALPLRCSIAAEAHLVAQAGELVAEPLAGQEPGLLWVEVQRLSAEHRTVAVLALGKLTLPYHQRGPSNQG